MLELFKKKKKLPNQDRQIPQTIQELIKRYDLDNTDIIKYLDEIIPQIFTIDGGEVNGDIILNNAHFLKGKDENNNLINLIRAYQNMTALGASQKETRLYSSVKPTIHVGGTVYTIATTDDVNTKVSKTVDVTTPGTNLDNYKENGSYWFNIANTPSNKPSGVSVQAGFLEVISYNTSANYMIQRWTEYNNNTVWQRVKNGSWSSWTKIAQEKNYITVYPSADKKLTADNTYQLWAMDTKQYSAGSKLSINSNGEVVIGKGVNHVRVSGQVYYYTGTNGLKSVQIQCNGVQIRSGLSLVNYNYLPVPAKDFPVSENQTIGLYVNGKTNDLFKAYSLGSFMTVEVID